LVTERLGKGGARQQVNIALAASFKRVFGIGETPAKALVANPQ
jgi:hypothetical protein